MKNIKKPKKQQVPPFKGRTLAKLEEDQEQVSSQVSYPRSVSGSYDKPAHTTFQTKNMHICGMEKRKLYYEPHSFHAELRKTWHTTGHTWGRLPGWHPRWDQRAFLLFNKVEKKWEEGSGRTDDMGWWAMQKKCTLLSINRLNETKLHGKKSCKDHHLTEIQNSGVRLLEIKICVQGAQNSILLIDHTPSN